MADSRLQNEDQVLDNLQEAFLIQGLNLVTEVERATKDGKKKFKCLYMRHLRRNKLFKAKVFKEIATKVIY
jgi:hypothetical protein